MSFELCFSPEFFFNEGEPYDGGPGPSERPTSVWQAILSMPEEDWRFMVEDCFAFADPEHIPPEAVLDMIRETNTCTDLRSPVEVWIDSEGYHTVRVYDRSE